MLAVKLAIIAGVVWILTTQVGAVRICRTNEMYPSLRDGDLFLAYRTRTVVTDDVVLYLQGLEEHYGRIIAAGGDTVLVTEEGVFVNDAYVLNSIPYRTRPQEGGPAYPLFLEADQYFILADLREESLDSRTYGPVRADEIIGKEIFCMRRRGF